MSFKFHHILYCSNFALIESFFKEVLLFEEESFQQENFPLHEFLHSNSEDQTHFLTYQDTHVFFKTEQSKQDRSPFLIHFEAGEWEEIQQRIEFWQYRHRLSLEEFELSTSETMGHLIDPNGQKIIFISNIADSCVVPEKTDRETLTN